MTFSWTWIFIPSQADPCIWLRNNPKLNLHEEISFMSSKPEELISIFKNKYELKVKGDSKLTCHLGADYFHDPDG